MYAGWYQKPLLHTRNGRLRKGGGFVFFDDLGTLATAGFARLEVRSTPCSLCKCAKNAFRERKDVPQKSQHVAFGFSSIKMRYVATSASRVKRLSSDTR